MTLGVYLLGALDPAERSSFESHLSYCEICRGELVRLAPLPGLLNQITPDDFADSMPSTDVEYTGPRAPTVTLPVPVPRQEVPRQRVDDVPEPRNRPRNRPKDKPRSRPTARRFWRTMQAAVAVVVVAVGAIFGWQALRHEPAPPQPDGVVWVAETSDGSASVEARMIDHEWGTEIQAKIHGMPPGRRCYLMVYDHYGNREVAGWWGTDHDPNEEIPASTSIHRSKIDRMELLLDDRSVALTVEAPR
jgi:hypothetical protein